MINKFFHDKKNILKNIVKLYKRRRWANGDAYFDWRKVINGQELMNNKKKQKVLIASSTGGLFNAISLEGLIAVSLSLRGVDVDVLLCDSALPACQECQITWYPDLQKFIDNGPQTDLCKHCFWPAEKMFKSQGNNVLRYSNYITKEDIEIAQSISKSISFDEIREYRLNGIAIGEHAYAGALRFFAVGTLAKNNNSEKILRKYLQASLLTVSSINQLLSVNNYDSAFFNHGIYVPQGLIGEVCRKKNVRVINWNPGYKKKTFIFSHDNTYHHTMMTESVDNWSNIKWNKKLDEQLMSYLKSRWHGSQDWIWFHHEPQFDLEKISNKTGINFNKPCVGVLTSVMWDAVLHYPSNAFTSMIEWIDHTIRFFQKSSDIQLIIRVHPAEIRGTLPSNQKMCDEIAKIYPELSENIFIIPPESDISTYAIMSQCDSVIIYNTKTGVELSAMGIPVIVAGEAWIRNKGFAIEVESKSGYEKILSRLPLNDRLEGKKLLLAKKYAYHFFFRRMIPLNVIEPSDGNIPYKVGVKSIEDLTKGKDVGLDTICNGIMEKEKFIYPAENYK